MNRINIHDCKIGDVLFGHGNTKTKNNHYMVFMDHLNGFDFVGAMVTTSTNFGNVQLSPEHIEMYNEYGQKHKFQYQGGHLVVAKLHKYTEMGPFENVGQLTQEGIQFVEAHIGHLKLKSWETVLASVRSKI